MRRTPESNRKDGCLHKATWEPMDSREISRKGMDKRNVIMGGENIIQER
jgi:hypothetical protein